MNATSLSKSPVKIGFVLLSNSRDPIPSTRIAVLNMFPFLRAANFDPHIAFEPEVGSETPDVSGLTPQLIAAGFRIVFFQKVHGTSVQGLARELASAGVRTVYGVCDRINEPMARETDVTIVVTDFLKSLYPADLRDRIEVVHDGIENPMACKQAEEDGRGTSLRPLNAVLVTSAQLTRLPVLGSPPAWLKVTIVGRYPQTQERLQRLREARWSLAKQPPGGRLHYLGFLLSRRIQRQPWDREGVYDHLSRANIGVIPIETNDDHGLEGGEPTWKLKSENRLTMKMSMGLPVIATPIPAYEAIIEHGVNGFLARTRSDWLLHLKALRDPGLRCAIGHRARESVREKYSMERQAQLLVSALQRVAV